MSSVGTLALGPASDAPLGRVNPVAQLTSMALLTVALVASLDLVTPSIVLAAELALLPAAHLTSPRVLLLRTWPMLLGAASLAVVNVLLSDAGVVQGVGLTLRVLALAFPGVLFASVVDPVRLADALSLHWRVPTRFAYGALAALRLVPLLIVELQTIRLARRARGVDAGRNPLQGAQLFARDTFTLLVGAVRRGTRLATAMDARGFDSGVGRTNARGSVLRRSDYAFVAMSALVCVAAVGVSVAVGAWSPIFIG